MRIANLSRRGALALGGGLLAATLARPTLALTDEEALRALVDGAHRAAPGRVRDRYRHPFETLKFFGVRPTSTIVEILPGGAAYWTEILAPYVKAGGSYIAALGEAQGASEETRKGNEAFAAKMAAAPELYGAVATSEFNGDKHPIARDGSADFVLTFRNVHNWMDDGTVAGAFRAFAKALKPGGVLGVEEHRGAPDKPQDPKAASGYVREDVVIGFAADAGLKPLARSEVNANPLDTKDYPVGVWALPPTLRMKEVDRDRFLAIGESDRMTLAFVKPA